MKELLQQQLPTWILLALCLGAGLLAALAGFSRRGRILGHIADFAGVLALLVALAIWLRRWMLAGHLPLFGTYESSLSLVLAIMCAGAALRWRLSIPGGVWAATGLTSALLLAHGLQYNTGMFALTISERSWVVDVHAFVAWGAMAVLAGNAGLALIVLRGYGGVTAERQLIFTLSLGFFVHSAMLASGSFYKFLLFGSTWSFDPVETLGLAAWLAYGTLLHMQLLAGWEPRRLARWCLLVFVLLLVSYRGIVYFPGWSTYHIFDVDLRLHG